MNYKVQIKSFLSSSSLSALLLGFLLCTQFAFAATKDRWQVVSMDGVAVGSVHKAESRADAGWIHTESTLIALNRLGARIEISTFQESVESEAGHLQAVRQEMKASDQTLVTRGHLESGDWVTWAGEKGSSLEQRRPVDGELLGPRGIRAALSGLYEPGDVVEYQAFLAQLGQPGLVRAELAGFEQFEGQRLRVVTETTNGIPAPLTRLIDQEGYTVVARMPGPFGLTETKLANETAARLANAGGELGEEVFRGTLIGTGARLPAPREMEYLEIELEHRNPSMGWPDFESASQTVLEKTPERLVLAVRRQHPQQSALLDDRVSDSASAFLQANRLLRADEAELVALARDIVGDERDTWQAALLLKRWVADNMRFDLGVVLAPSDEVLASRRGTCAEYAILLTALARAVGIPARYVSGYVYVHGAFGGHAWTQVLVGEQWIDLDAAMPSSGAADAARFGFLWTGLDNAPGELNSGPALQMYGQLNGRILAWRTADGVERRFAEGAPAPRLVDGRFVDAVQGMKWSVPNGWRIVDHQETWPSSRIAAAENMEGERVDLYWLPLLPWERVEEGPPSRFLAQADGWKEFDGSTGVDQRQAWRIQHRGRAALAMAGRNGYWVLDGDCFEHIERLASTLVLPQRQVR